MVESLQSRLERLEFYQDMLLEFLQDDKLDFYKIIVQAKMNKSDVEELLQNCEALSNELELQKAEGFIGFTPLLAKFAGKLHNNLEVEKTIEAMLKIGLYKPLMLELNKIINKDESN